jgi:hypothetical protein
MSISYPFSSNPNDTQQWSVLKLGEFNLPGVVVGFNIQNTFDYSVTKQKGTHKAIVDFQGTNPRVIDATLLIYDKKGFDAFVNGLAKDLSAKASAKATTPLAIYHPQAAMFGINLVNLLSVMVPMPDASNGFIYTLNLLEYIEKPQPAKTDKKVEKNKPANQQGIPKRQPTPPSNPSV